MEKESSFQKCLS
jgi:hypothetical protein